MSSGCGAGTWPPASCWGGDRVWPRSSSISTRPASATTGATQQILFGSIFTVDPSTVPIVVVLERGDARSWSAAIHRPLLLSSVSPELASARGIGLRTVGLLFMLALAVSVGLSSIAIGSILSTALLIGPRPPPCG